MTGQLIPIQAEYLLTDDKRVRDLMVPLEDYPHIPHWFSLSQAMGLLREDSAKFNNSFEPRAALVFDEKRQLKGILTLRDIIKGLEHRFSHETPLSQGYPYLILLMKGIRRAGLREAAQHQVDKVMSPIKVTIDGEAPINQALLLMVKEHTNMVPVTLDQKVAGMISLNDLYKEISKVILGD